MRLKASWANNNNNNKLQIYIAQFPWRDDQLRILAIDSEAMRARGIIVLVKSN